MRIGIDLGGTKVEGVVLGKDGCIEFQRRVPTPSSSYDEIIETIVELVSHLERDVGASRSVGIGMPGIISPHSGLVKNSNTTVLNGEPFDRDLTARLGRELHFENDANCFVLSEAIDGAGRVAEVVFGVIIGTGTGGGIAVQRRVIRGANAIAGEWGHNPLPWPTDKEPDPSECYCGKRGCIETYLCGAGLISVYEKVAGTTCGTHQIAALAQSGDQAARRAVEVYTDRLARSLASVVNVIDPDVVVLGGGLSNLKRLYENVPKKLAAYVFSDTVETILLPPEHRDSSGVRGAARLWPVNI